MRRLMQQALISMPPLIGLALAACAHQTGQERSAAIQAQTVVQGWQSQVIRTPQFDLQVFTNNQPAVNSVLNVYIEGDGYAWIDGQFPSDDPTPHTPLALQLAMAQLGGAVAYLGRPCQYIGAETDARCNKKVWTDARFSETVVAASNTAIDQLKAQQKARQVRLVGYSGGAAVALLVAAQRNDITQIITVAGNLDPHTWAKQLKLQPLTGSLDTATIIPSISQIPQVAFVGGKDRVVPADLIVKFAQHYPPNQQPRIINEPGFGHVCCWAEHWPQLWMQATTQ
jgi:dienelactone hydrolase